MNKINHEDVKKLLANHSFVLLFNVLSKNKSLIDDLINKLKKNDIIDVFDAHKIGPMIFNIKENNRLADCYSFELSEFLATNLKESSYPKEKLTQIQEELQSSLSNIQDIYDKTAKLVQDINNQYEILQNLNIELRKVINIIN